MIIPNVKPFNGQHCETTATGILLKSLGIELSEPMLFGLGEGLGFIFWNMKIMNFPFIGGRIKPDVLTQHVVNNLNLKMDAKETASVKTAWQNVSTCIDQGVPVGLKLDCYHLEYFTRKFHFAAHYAAAYGYDNEYAYLIDTKQQGGKVRTSLKSLELARNEKGPMSSRNRSYIIRRTDKGYDLKQAVKTAIQNNAKDFLNPPIKNIGYRGILKTSIEIKKWFKNSKNISRDFKTTAMLMEKAGTGGALFRNLYRDFLKESAVLLDSETVHQGYQNYKIIAGLWTEVSLLFDRAGETARESYISHASDILVELSDKEKRTMALLAHP